MSLVLNVYNVLWKFLVCTLGKWVRQQLHTQESYNTLNPTPEGHVIHNATENWTLWCLRLGPVCSKWKESLSHKQPWKSLAQPVCHQSLTLAFWFLTDISVPAYMHKHSSFGLTVRGHLLGLFSSCQCRTPVSGVRVGGLIINMVSQISAFGLKLCWNYLGSGKSVLVIMPISAYVCSSYKVGEDSVFTLFSLATC